MDEVLECGCRYEDREIPYAQEFVPEIDCPVHGVSSVDTRYIDLIATLHLYIGHHAETKLTTEQRELLYDAVEQWRERHMPGECEPMERWWR